MTDVVAVPSATGQTGGMAPRLAGRFYYGWVCVGVAALAMVATLPGRTIGLGLVTEPLLRDLGLSRTTYSHVNLWATLIGAGFGLGCGRLIDRVGARAVLTGVSLLLGIVVLVMSRVGGLWGLFVTVTLTRGLGQSALSTASIAIVGKWFERKADRAMAVYSVLLTIGFMIAIPSLEAVVRHGHWRAAWAGIGIALLFGMAPVAWVMGRSSPEAVGLAIDGLPRRPGQAADGPPAGFTLAQALASPAFWAFAAGGFLFYAAYSGITLFNESILADRGFAGSASGPLIVIVFAGLAANFGAGWLAGRWPITRVLAVAMLLLAGSLVLLPQVRTRAGVMAYAAAMGVAAGAVTVVFFSCWGRTFGRRHLGKIQGAAQGLMVIASAAGPLVLAEYRARFGSYAVVFYALSASAAACAAFCWAVRVPARPAQPTSSG